MTKRSEELKKWAESRGAKFVPADPNAPLRIQVGGRPSKKSPEQSQKPQPPQEQPPKQ